MIGKSVKQEEMPDDRIPPVGDTVRLEHLAIGSYPHVPRSFSCHLLPSPSVSFHLRPSPPSHLQPRLEYRKLQILLEPLSETSTRASLMLSIDPKMRVLPMAFVEGILRRTVCMLFWLCRRAALKAGTGEGPHAAAIRADPAFYQDFLAPRICAHFERRAKAKAQVGVVNGSRPKW